MMTRDPRARRLFARLAAAGLLLTALAACAGSPADFTDISRLGSTTPNANAVRQPEDRAAVERDLTATADRQASAGRGAAAGLPSAMALAIIRQQQTEEARELLRAAGPAPVASQPATAATCGGEGQAPCAPTEPAPAE